MITEPMTVLIAEDDPDEKEIYTVFLSGRKDLELKGFFENGVTLLKYLDAQPPATTYPDLIFLDHNMPLETGLQVLQKLKASDRYATIPVVLLSTYADPALESRGIDAGAVAVFNKPLTAPGYNAMIDEIMKRLGRG